MSFSSGTFSLYTPGNPVVTGTTISSTAFNNTMNDIATGLSTCLLKDGSQTITANIPMGGFKLTGLAAATTNGDAVRWQQSAAGVLTTTGDTLYASAANTLARLAIGAAGGILMVNAGATAPSWLAIGTARQQLATNSGATAAEWVASLQSLMTTTGDILQASSANTPARLAIGSARQVPTVNAGATALAYANQITIATEQATTSGTAVDFTSIPSGVRRITIMFKGVSTNGTSAFLVQIGDSDGIETSGYSSGAESGTTKSTSTAGFLITPGNTAAVGYSGNVTLTLELIASFAWTSSGCIADTTNGDVYVSGGSKATSLELDRVRITMVNGTDAFDAGAINISYE